jgi:hypothetical protein
MSFVNGTGVRAVTPGSYQIFVGGGQPRANAPGKEAHLTITGKRILPRYL